ncbi:hypothetical protein Enr13x_14280 [Stieleria neptunia]|uniref:Uncharacterized protein n=1 Tax=Stieleria neptunia TaxID=2527979 RepID=A0A518HL53_9BACT|nr:hypothetical protein [Stieleria neptunia]QDV41585.1 hypothetical protein Enr13x_14280 [Stieleria neptunia]
MIVQKESYPDSVELLGWSSKWTEADLEAFIKFVIDRFPTLSEPERQVSLGGKRWPTFCPSGKFLGKLRRQGAKNLETYIFRELEPRLDIRFDLDNSRCPRLNIACSTSEWNQRGGSKILNDLLSVICFEYGHFGATKYFNIDHLHRIAASPTFGGPSISPWAPPASDVLLPVSQYEKLLIMWENDRNIGVTNTYDFIARPLLVFPTSIVNAAHLTLSVDGDVNLRSWIDHRRERGNLFKVNEDCYLWNVDPNHVESVTRELWQLSFFNASEHFEIGGWDHELNLPLFRHVKQLNRRNFPNENKSNGSGLLSD